jgi:hypothetical protein
MLMLIAGEGGGKIRRRSRGLSGRWIADVAIGKYVDVGKWR